MSYVDAFHDKDTIRVVERIDGQRQHKVYPAEYTFYFDDKNGKYTTVYDTPVSKYTCKSKKAFHTELKHWEGYTWEADYRPLNRCLETFYGGAEAPNLNVAFWDIEVDFDPSKGFAPPDDPFNPITAISIYMQWEDTMITLAIPPKGMSMDVAEHIGDKFENCLILESEEKLLSVFLDLLDDVDVLSGWNSEGFDIPYTINRIKRVLTSDDTRKFCLWGQKPKKRVFERYGAEQVTYDLKGRVHLDYMQLYRKFTYHEMHSYSLDAIGEHEVQEKKIEYEGTLDQLYNNDFEKFIAYNRQDTALLDKIDKKLDFISLANSMAHENTCLLPKVMGAVAIHEQAIINETHRLGFIVPNKVHYDDPPGAAGAYVAYPKKGIHEWIGSIDINSLYPSAIRALNMAPETVVGQVRQTDTIQMIEDHLVGPRLIKGKKNTFASAWEGHFSSLEYKYIMDRRTDIDVIIDWDENWLRTADCKEATFARMQDSSTEMSGNEAWQMLFEGENPWMMSANGTIFSYEKKGIIPGLLEGWYTSRQVMQKTKGRFLDLAEGIIKLPDTFTDVKVTGGVEAMRDLDFDALFKAFEDNNQLASEKLLNRYNVSIISNSIIPDKVDVKLAISFWDKLQLVRKISLNSLYGALLNPHCRFFDQRIGQSTTLTGRAIAKHMSSFVNESLTGQYDYTGDSIIYGDTDSVYFSVWPSVKEAVESGDIEWDADTATELYDAISDQCNVSFPGFMQKSFHCPTQFGKIIKGGREITASKALFITKKRYAALVVDLEGKRQDVDGKPGYLKAMGLDLKRSDTPPVVQVFLKDILMDLLSGKGQDEIFEKIKDFKRWFSTLKSWEKGSPKRANRTSFYKSLADNEHITRTKTNMPGHVRASLNYNTLRKINSDNYSMEIKDGQKVIVCKLRKNPMGFDSVAIPVDESTVPQWFQNLPFDDNAMEDAIVNKKIDNLFGVLDWPIEDFTDTRSTFNELFKRN